MITFELRIILVFLFSFFSVIFILPKIANIAKRIGLLDQPNARKMHTQPRPLVGGIGMVISVTFTSLAFIPISGLRGYFLGLATLLLVGFLDDFKELGHRQKFLAQIFASILMIYFSKVALYNFGDLTGLGDLIVPGGNFFVWLVTVFCVVGVTNAVNMIDGLDGLAGGVSFIAFIFYAIHASFAGDHILMLLSLAFAGAILGFLKFNWHPSVIFMGDAGSLCLGFSLAFMALALTQKSGSEVSPVVPLLILALPITDTITVMCRRVLKGNSPFKPDRYHLHHIFLRYGLSRAKAVEVILVLSIFFGGISIIGAIYNFSDTRLFSIFATFFTIYLGASIYITGFLKYNLSLRKNRKHQGKSDIFLRLIFENFDHFHIFRKSRRYQVDINVRCTRADAPLPDQGRILNISGSGCMAQLNALSCDEKNMLLSFSLTHGKDSFPFTLKVEHIWTANQDGNDYHGFKFSYMPSETIALLSSCLKHLETKQ